jgi:hypothetical protein
MDFVYDTFFYYVCHVTLYDVKMYRNNGWLDMFRFVVERSSYSVRISIHLDLMSLT